MVGEEHLLVCELWQLRPTEAGSEVHGEAGAEAGPPLEQRAPGVKLVTRGAASESEPLGERRGGGAGGRL